MPHKRVITVVTCRERGEPVPSHMAHSVARAVKEKHCLVVSDAAKVSKLQAVLCACGSTCSAAQGPTASVSSSAWLCQRCCQQLIERQALIQQPHPRLLADSKRKSTSAVN